MRLFVVSIVLDDEEVEPQIHGPFESDESRSAEIDEIVGENVGQRTICVCVNAIGEEDIDVNLLLDGFCVGEGDG